MTKLINFYSEERMEGRDLKYQFNLLPEEMKIAMININGQFMKNFYDPEANKVNYLMQRAIMDCHKENWNKNVDLINLSFEYLEEYLKIFNFDKNERFKARQLFGDMYKKRNK